MTRSHGAGSALRPAEIHRVIDTRAIRTVFQPLVRLDTREVVGYEALSRGPAGTVWERPAVLFTAAEAVGRLAELDWICRARAYEAALTAGLDPLVTLFVNTEPLALDSECPPDLRKWVHVARERLRVVTEMTERAVSAHPSALLTAAATARSAGWGVALDDVGAHPASLAMLPFVHPDVVKLDLHLIHQPDRPEVARVVNAVVAYAEQTGATILAEGIETEEHVATARGMGATLGQGWLFGRGDPLPRAVRAPRTPVRFVPAPQTARARQPGPRAHPFPDSVQPPAYEPGHEADAAAHQPVPRSQGRRPHRAADPARLLPGRPLPHPGHRAPVRPPRRQRRTRRGPRHRCG